MQANDVYLFVSPVVTFAVITVILFTRITVDLK